MSRNRFRTAAVRSAVAAAVAFAALAGADQAGAAPTPVISVGDATVHEGNTKARNVYVPVTLTAPATSPVTVQYQVVGGTATPGKPTTVGADFNDKNGATGTISFVPGGNGKTPVKKQVAIPVYADTAVEGDETFSVVLSNPTGPYALGRTTGTVAIVDDDPGPSGVVSVGDATVVEGDDGKVGLQFTISLSEPVASNASVDVTVGSGSATCGPVYYGRPRYPGTDCAEIVTPKTIPFRVGGSGFTPSFKVLTVNTFPDLDVEGDETFTVTLSNPQGVALGDASGVGTVIDDD